MPSTKSCEVSLFMPVYNGTRYLAASIGSVLRQTFTDFELVCVDDSSTDDSWHLLQSLALQDERIRLFQKHNGGMVPPSWNFALPHLQGQSIFYLSQDDILSEDLLANMVQRQQETGADCVLPDMVWYHEGATDDKVIVGVNGDRGRLLSAKEAVALSLTWQIHGFALWKAHLFEGRAYLEDAFDSDELFIRESFLRCNRIAFSDGIFYYRRDNSEAITKTFDQKNYYSVLTRLRIYRLLKEHQLDEATLNFALITAVYFLFLNWRYSNLRKKELSEEALCRIRKMFEETYRALEIDRLWKCALQGKGVKRFKYLLVYLVFANYGVLKAVMKLTHGFDRFRRGMGIYNIDQNSGIRW